MCIFWPQTMQYPTCFTFFAFFSRKSPYKTMIGPEISNKSKSTIGPKISAKYKIKKINEYKITSLSSLFVVSSLWSFLVSPPDKDLP